MTHLKDKIAVVTGASQGLGRRVALNLAARSVVVAMVARSEDGLRKNEQEIRRAGGWAHSFPTDISDQNAVMGLRKQVEECLGVTAILVNAAGVFGPIQLIQDNTYTCICIIRGG